jgi:hypothetical protein
MTNECSCAFSKMRWGNIARNSSTSERRASLFANFRRSGVRTPMIEPGSIFGMSFAAHADEMCRFVTENKVLLGGEKRLDILMN